MPGSKVLMPLPDFAIESRFCIDLELVHIDFFTKNLDHRPNQSWVGTQTSEAFVIGMGSKRSAGHPTGFDYHLFPFEPIHPLSFFA